MHQLAPFHLAFPVHDIEATRHFYTQVLGAKTGREDASWIDFDLCGHQIVAHLMRDMKPAIDTTNPVDGNDVPVPHFGVVLEMKDWKALSDALLRHDDIRWVIKPTIRFKGEPGEQATFFILDPSGNALEFKAFADISNLFAT